jgi:poly [ADP-ribose] polymerase
MPPKAAKKAASAAPPLHGCIIALSGTFPGLSQPAVEQDYINALGATLSKTVNASTTHLVTTDTDFAKPSAKAKQAKSHDVHIVKLAWLEDCLNKTARLSEDGYTFGVPAGAATTNGKANGSRKRTADDAEDDESQPKKKSKPANGSNTQSQEVTKPKLEPKASKLKTGVSDGQINIAKSSDISIPVDETCPLTHYRVYIDNSGVIYDAALNQTNASNNNNKFYRVQVCDGFADLSRFNRANIFPAPS